MANAPPGPALKWPLPQQRIETWLPSSTLSAATSAAPPDTPTLPEDDGALLTPAAGMQVVVSTDMLVAGTHFLADCDPEALGWKALAVEHLGPRRDGRSPRWATLALSLPTADEGWLGVRAGLLRRAVRFDVDLIGGDTTRGALNLCPTVSARSRADRRSLATAPEPVTNYGFRASRDALRWPWRRCAANSNSRARGQAPLSLRRSTGPSHRVALGLALRGPASAMLDVSDGLLGDLGHILERSGVGCTVH